MYRRPWYLLWPPVIVNGTKMCRLVNRKKTWRLNPFKAAVPLWGQTTYNWTGLSPKRDCGSKRVKRGFGRTQKDRSPRTGRVAFFVAGGSNWLLLLPTTGTAATVSAAAIGIAHDVNVKRRCCVLTGYYCCGTRLMITNMNKEQHIYTTTYCCMYVLR